MMAFMDCNVNGVPVRYANEYVPTELEDRQGVVYYCRLDSMRGNFCF